MQATGCRLALVHISCHHIQDVSCSLSHWHRKQCWPSWAISIGQLPEPSCQQLQNERVALLIAQCLHVRRVHPDCVLLTDATPSSFPATQARSKQGFLAPCPSSSGQVPRQHVYRWTWCMWATFAAPPALLAAAYHVFVTQRQRWRRGYYHVHQAVQDLQSDDIAVQWQALDRVSNVRVMLRCNGGRHHACCKHNMRRPPSWPLRYSCDTCGPLFLGMGHREHSHRPPTRARLHACALAEFILS